jgi:hypothetical protein
MHNSPTPTNFLVSSSAACRLRCCLLPAACRLPPAACCLLPPAACRLPADLIYEPEATVSYPFYLRGRSLRAQVVPSVIV